MLPYTEEKNKPASVWQGWTSHKPGGRQVLPDQTKAVKGQNGKTLAMADAIKGPMPCPEKGIEKQSILRSKKKNRAGRTEKKDKKENREEKKGN